MSLANEDVTVTDADREKAAELLMLAVLGNTDGGIVADGDLPASEIARLLSDEAAPAIAAALAFARAEADQLRDAMRALAEEWEREDDWNEIAPSTAAARVRDLADGGRR